MDSLVSRHSVGYAIRTGPLFELSNKKTELENRIFLRSPTLIQWALSMAQVWRPRGLGYYRASLGPKRKQVHFEACKQVLLFRLSVILVCITLRHTNVLPALEKA
ncbi:hypothetical protein TorRG33x02_201250 [Trema orientale]|uniref:Uncharacterized protein n=1 Tax=Trema orientale TaxID=63057 RepID=A0A2P5EEZ5_TREOI|nr:hypothetical protein TorRG33x02_201250 [Trema orientale]